MSTGTRADIKFTRFESVSGTWRVAFSCSDTITFERVVDAIKALPLLTRRWDPRSKHWLITEVGMRLLAAANPVLWEMMERAKRERADEARRAEENRARERQRGQDERDAAKLFEVSELEPGHSGAADYTFTKPYSAGILEFSCHVAGHFEEGMKLPFTGVGPESPWR
jgi:hypothetical protein